MTDKKEVSAERLEFIRKRVAELTVKIKSDVMPEHRRRCEEREKTHPNNIRFDDEIMRALNSNSLVAELRRLQNICPHDFTDFEENKSLPTPAKTKRCKICNSNETIFSLKGGLS